MDFNTSPSSSATSSPISIGWPSPSSPLDYSSRRESISANGMTCAFPSWPKGPSLGFNTPFRTSAPSAFISDADLFGDEFLDGATPLLQEAPAPPRDIPFPAAAVPLAPLYAHEKPKKTQRRRSSNKKRRPSKPMSPIAEGPELPE